MSSNSEVGFIKALFDFKLHHFITMRVLRFLYTITTILIVIGGAIFMLSGLINGGSQGILFVILTPLGVLLYLIVVRLYVELLANLQRIGDNTQKMADQSPSA